MRNVHQSMLLTYIAAKQKHILPTVLKHILHELFYRLYLSANSMQCFVFFHQRFFPPDAFLHRKVLIEYGTLTVKWPDIVKLGSLERKSCQQFEQEKRGKMSQATFGRHLLRSKRPSQDLFLKRFRSFLTRSLRKLKNEFGMTPTELNLLF